ncbi:DUF262 domain-containing protein [Solirubrobacter pauli]|nr:DUF262 domain-containing protein [Solirubrobacter pauli]
MDHLVGGRLRIPAFQRGFVWDAERVAFFMDSVYKGYPFGNLLLWRTRQELTHERDLGPYQLPAGDPEYPIDYVLDGQQRLTSLFGVFQNSLQAREPDERFNVYFDRQAEDSLQSSQFFALPLDQPVDSARYFPLRVLFDVVAYRQATEPLEGDDLLLIDEMQTRFKEVQVPTQTFETDDRGRVAIVFERVNRLGVELDTLQLLSAWTWSDDFFLQEKFEDLGEDLEPFGFKLVGEDTNLLLRCCSAIIQGEAAPAALMQLDGDEVRERFDEISNGILGAIDFLRTNLHVGSMANLPFGTLIVPLAVFFSAKGNSSVVCTSAQRKALLKWFWRSSFSRRYSSDVIRKLELDIQAMLQLKGDVDDSLIDIDAPVWRSFFTGSMFNTSSVNTKTFVLLLTQAQPRSFVSGAPISLQRVLKDYNRNEFHHLYPRRYLKDLGYETSDINGLANFVFMARADNNKLGGEAPSMYRRHLPGDGQAAILRHALCPASLFSDDYDLFLEARGETLTRAAKALVADGELDVALSSYIADDWDPDDIPF